VTACSTPSGGLGGGLADLWLAQPGVSRRASTGGEPWANSNADARTAKPGETIVIADLRGPGVITHIWNTVASEEPSYSRLLVLRMYWDDEEQPSVEAPLGDFFGVGHGLDLPVNSVPVRVGSQGRARNCYWRMPFRKAARITVTNEGKLPAGVYAHVDWVQLPSLPKGALFFHAMYRQEHPTVMGERYLLADIAGRGHYVGTVLSIRARSESWFGEGDDFFFIDGDEEPTLMGTGTEDYFGDAFGLHEQQGAFWGASRVEVCNGGYSTAYRWHIADPIVFQRSLRAEFEHTGFAGAEAIYGERVDDFSSVALWYQTEPHARWPSMPEGYERLHGGGFFESVLEMGISKEKKIDLLEQAFLYDAPVVTDPLWNDGGVFKDSHAPVALRNRSGLPVSVHGDLEALDPIRVQPADTQLVLSPGEERTIGIALSSESAVPVASLAPVLADWTFRYEWQGAHAIGVTQRCPIVVETPFVVPYRSDEVSVDGQLDEWHDLPYCAAQPGQLRMSPAAWSGVGDCSFRFGVASSADYLWLAVEAVDDSVVKLGEMSRWFQDGIEVRVDARPDPERSNWNEWGGEFEQFIFLAMLPGEAPGEQNVYSRDMLPDGVQAVCVRTGRGHNTEIAIPHAALDGYRGNDWDALRINIAINDLDRADGEFVQYWWRRDWRSPESYPGSGTFTRR